MSGKLAAQVVDYASLVIKSERTQLNLAYRYIVKLLKAQND
jgi:hypothetical protein